MMQNKFHRLRQSRALTVDCEISISLEAPLDVFAGRSHIKLIHIGGVM